MIVCGVGITVIGLFTIFFVTLIKMEDDHRCSKIDQLFAKGQFRALDFYKHVDYPINARDDAEKDLKNVLTCIYRLPTKYKSNPTDIKTYIHKVGNVNVIFKKKKKNGNYRAKIVD
jgi:hypothetical protein